MTRTLVVEEESGTCRGWVHPHNGYHAGDFSTTKERVVACGAAASRHLTVVPAPRAEARTADSGPVSWRTAA